MSVKEKNAAEEKEKTDEAKPEQKDKQIKRGKENACGFRKHLNLEQKNSMDKYRPKLCLDADGPVEFHSGESDEVRDSQIIL
ncbi:hypothetical protein DPX16_1421 [Anabarilius grahami]|uniref:Uncharacterized protein n=1 Tax=Anabarilius grahami TaxID=495550 RepID=A0A3N0YKV6_ANAGA|nr:hypothetical protein DPX16_1421 [Anabarilius grahami]